MVFSIIIATYNASKTLKNCLESILNQHFSDFEVLIIDGLSNDDTVSIANSYKDDRIKVFSEADKGVYDAMNKGIIKASAEWLYFLGADDTLYDENVLANIHQFIKSTPRTDIVYGDAFFIGRKYLYDGEFSRIKLFREKNICHQAIFYKKEIFNRLGNYNTDFQINADWDFNLRCFATPDLNIQYINLPIANYNDLSGLSNSGNRDNFFLLSGAALYEELNEIKQYNKLISAYKRIRYVVFLPCTIGKKVWRKLGGK